MTRSITPQRAWQEAQRGELRILDLRTRVERRQHGWPPGARKVSLTRHALVPGGADVVYLCQHAKRSKLTGRRGAAEVAGGFGAWLAAGLPVEHPGHRRT